MKFLLDTNVASELRKPKPHGAVLAWFASCDPLDFAISTIVIYEIQAGIELLRPQNPQKAAEFELWLNGIMQRLTILPLSAEAARETARLMSGKSLDILEDAMIAATAKVHGLTIATRNTSDFDHSGVPQVDPFLFPRS